MFKDRADAARRLARRLAPYRDRQPLVLGVPRGAVPMGVALARALHGAFDVVLVRKLPAPHQAELAVGSVDEWGHTHIAPHAAEAGADPAYIDAEVQRQLGVLRQRRACYSPLRPPVDPAGRVVIVVDDGMATGFTMTAALHGLRLRHPARLVCAVPVSSRQALEQVRPLADALVCLDTPEPFTSVGQWYRHFPQVDDDEVIALLRGMPGPSPV